MDTSTLARAVVPKPARRLVASVLRAVEATQQRAFERWLGVSTTGNVYSEEGVAETGRVFYEHCEWLPVHRALRELRPQPSDVFVDIGAGKGQALLIAARLPYARVIGVEVDEELARIATRNIERARRRLRASATEIVSADALEWSLPDDTSVVFLYCPFIGELFHKVLERVFASYDRNPRDLFVVYCFPFEHNWLVSTGRVEVEAVRPARWPAPPWWWKSSWVIATYRVVTEGKATAPKVGRRLSRSRAATWRWCAQNDHRFWVGEPGAKKVYSDDVS